MTLKNLVKEIEKRTMLTYQEEDEEGNLVDSGIYTLTELIESLKQLEKSHNEAVKSLRKCVKRGIKKGELVGVDAVLVKDKNIKANIYLLGEQNIISHCYITGKIIG